MASPILESQAVSPTLSDHGYHPGLSGPDLAIGRAMTTAQAQWTAHFNQLQTCQRLLEARLESQTQMMSHMSDVMAHILSSVHPQPQPPQRRQGRPHPGKSMRAKKRKQAQALLEPANSSSEGPSDADCPGTAAGAAQASSKLGLSAAAASAASAGAAASPSSTPPVCKVATTLQPIAAQAPTPAQPVHVGSASVDATAAPAPPAATKAHEPQQIEEGWLNVAAHVEESSTSIRAPPSVAAATSSLEANKEALVKAAAEEACGKLLKVVKKELMEATQVVAKEALATTLAEGLQQHSQSAQRDIAAAVEAFQDQLAAFKEEMLQQLHAEQRHGLEALKEEQQKEAAAIRAALTGTLAPLATLHNEQQSNFEQLRRDLQEVQRKNEELLAYSAQHFRPISDDVAAMKLELAELKACIAHLAGQQPRAQEAQEAPVAAEDADAGDALGSVEDLPPPPGLSGATAAGQTETPAPMQTLQAEEAVSEATDVTAVAIANLTTLAPRTPPRCRVVACHWYKAFRTGWGLEEKKELAEPFLVTATTLLDVKVKAAKALFPGGLLRDRFKELRIFDGSRCLPSQEQEERRSLQDLGCGEGSLLKLHFRRDLGRHYWWSYEVLGCNSH